MVSWRHPYQVYPAACDLRRELEELLSGGVEPPHEHLMVLRRMRFDPTGRRLPCACQQAVTREGNRDQHCPFCSGEGWLWDEIWFTGFRARIRSGTRRRLDELSYLPSGQQFPEVTFVYSRYHLQASQHDRILVPEINPDGLPNYPLRFVHYYYISKIDCYRGDNGRVDYCRFTLWERLPGGPPAVLQPDLKDPT